MAQVMPEIANCPLCGKEPYCHGKDSYSKFGISCCGHTIWTRDNPDAWNRYAAAMELAKSTVEYENSNKSTVAKNGARLTEAYDKVLGVCK